MIKCSDSCIACNALDYEADSIQFLKDNLNKDMLFLDVGAHAGLFSLALRETAGRVIAIEAHPAHFKTLQANLPKDFLINAVAWSKVGQARLVYKDEPGQHYAERGHGWDSVSVDSILGAYTGDLAVKIDVEGAELEVLKGMEYLLGLADKVYMVIELAKWHLKRNNNTITEVHQHLLDRGFELVNYDGHPAEKKKLKAHYVRSD